MPRKREAETYDDDGGFVADAPKSKKSKAGSEKAKATVSATAKEGSEGDAAALEQRKGKGEDGGEFWSVRLSIFGNSGFWWRWGGWRVDG